MEISFGVVLNDIPGDVPLPVELQGWVLDRATEDEVAQLRPDLLTYAAPYVGTPAQEFELIPQGDGVRYEPAPSRKWRYCVVRPTESVVMTGAQLAEALRVSDPDLWVELWATTGAQDGLLGSPGSAAEFFGSWLTRPLLPTGADLVHLADTTARRAALDEDRFPDRPHRRTLPRA